MSKVRELYPERNAKIRLHESFKKAAEKLDKIDLDIFLRGSGREEYKYSEALIDSITDEINCSDTDKQSYRTCCISVFIHAVLGPNLRSSDDEDTDIDVFNCKTIINNHKPILVKDLIELSAVRANRTASLDH